MMIELFRVWVRRLLPLARAEKAQALVEYSLIFVLIIIVVLITLIVLGNTVKNIYCNIAGAVVNP